MWYEIEHPVSWAGLNEFLSGALSLFSSTFNVMLGQPVLVLFLAAFLMGVVLFLVRELFKASRR